MITAGGTNLSVRRDGSYLQETAWEDILENRGTGGGLNPVDARPAWETGPGVDNRFSNGKRQYPDVAAAADPDSGYFTVTPNEKTGASEAGVSGGTSAASPFWAASMLLIEQYAERHGVKKLEPLGERFDPNLHEALFEVPDESVPAGTVTQVVESGYTIGDRVLRPAKVGVSKGGAKA